MSFIFSPLPRALETRKVTVWEAITKNALNELKAWLCLISVLSLLFGVLSQYLMYCRLFPLGWERDERVMGSSDEPLFVYKARSDSRFLERSRARAVGDHFLAHHTDPPLPNVQYQQCFLSFISEQLRSSSVALGNASLLPFLAVSPLFFFLFPTMYKTCQSNLRNLCTCVCLAHSDGLHGGCCCSCINPATRITERAYCVNYFSKR